MTESEITLKALFDFATAHLPDGWELRLCMSRGEATLGLYDPQGNDASPDDPPGDDSGRYVESMVNAARMMEGLGPAIFGETKREGRP